MSDHAAFLFDMDGTILTSIPAVERAWTSWANHVGVCAPEVLACLHGRRAVDTVRQFAPSHLDIDAEVAWLTAAEIADTDGVEPIRGAADLLARLPGERWAIVTSAGRNLALRRIEAAGLPLPKILISADDVTRGKPDPQGFLMAAERLGVDPRQCLVFEDTDAGLTAGRAAGAAVIRILGTHHSAADGDTLGITGYDQLDIQIGRDRIMVQQIATTG